MRLIGMLDSPYVRRVAISLQLLDLRFERASISVLRQFDAFAAINPVVKSPTLVADDGEVLMESSLILDCAEAIAAGRESLMPAGPRKRKHALRLIDRVTSALTWHFIQQMSVASLVPPPRFPALQALGAQAETLPAFRAAPHGDTTYRDAPH